MLKYTILLLMLLFTMLILILVKPAHAWDEWSKESYISFGAMIFFSTLDTMQTIEIAKNPDKYWEANKMMGPHPSVERVVLFMVGAKLVIYGVSFLLPDKWRIILFSTQAGASAACVWLNNASGIQIKF